MVESRSEYLNIPLIREKELLGKKYGLIKTDFIKKYGSLSNYNVPWKNLKLEEVEFNDFKSNLCDPIYVLVDSFKAPIFACSKGDLDNLFIKNFKPYDVDIYVFDEKLTKCIVYTGLYDNVFYLVSTNHD